MSGVHDAVLPVFHCNISIKGSVSEDGYRTFNFTDNSCVSDNASENEITFVEESYARPSISSGIWPVSEK